MRYATNTIRAYSKSKGIKLIEGFFEAYIAMRGAINDSVRLIIASDFDRYNQDYVVPDYIEEYLEYIRKQQVEVYARASPAVFDTRETW